jgi:GNAT superfamily N-acetyltransferase
MTSLQLLDIKELSRSSLYGQLRQDQPDKCLFGTHSHCSMWWKNPPESEYQLGVIGHFSVSNAAEAHSLIDTACEYLRSKGCNAVIGPMNGNTWRPYRFVTWSDGSAPFLMEPQNHAQWPEFWQQAGFLPYHEYISSQTDNLERSDPRLPRAKERLKNAGTTWRPIDLSRFEEELRKVYYLSLKVFSNNVLYTPLNEKSFLRQYTPYAEKIDRDYVLLAEDHKHRCCGFIFAIPDLLQLQRGEKLSRLIIKTLAVSPSRCSAGLGSVLVEEIQKRALHNGLNSAIHALMFSKNNSANIGRHTHVIRRYTLYIKKI